MSSITNTFSSLPTTFYSAVSSVPSAASSASVKACQFLEDINDRLHFLFEFLKDPLANGSIIPSSIHLTKKVVQFIPEKSQASEVARRYLEVGAGTGSFTTGIVERLRFNDTLDIVELNPSFCATLKNKYSDHKNVHIHCLSITDWNPEDQYDAVISGLPLNAFSHGLVEQCLEVFKKVTKNDGTISYFEYPNISKICLKLYYGEKKSELEKVLKIKEQFFSSYGFQSEIVEQNFPTAKVLHFRMRKSDNESSNESSKQAATVPTLPDAP
ncbi:MAG TPA: methyltransferase domain-containing protein [Parachlamydiaceae bacterium]|nr:methyltransferase domain-containing protein [Parachlamydiaceae bacterium]